jgi:hypothetical protein
MHSKRMLWICSMLVAFALPFVSRTARASTTIAQADAEFLVEGIVADSDAYAVTQLAGAPSLTTTTAQQLTFSGSDNSQVPPTQTTGTLSGSYTDGTGTVSVALNYTSDQTQFATTGAIPYTVTGSANGQTWTESGTVTFSGSPSSFTVNVSSNVTYNAVANQAVFNYSTSGSMDSTNSAFQFGSTSVTTLTIGGVAVVGWAPSLLYVPSKNLCFTDIAVGNRIFITDLIVPGSWCKVLFGRPGARSFKVVLGNYETVPALPVWFASGAVALLLAIGFVALNRSRSFRAVA